jgi:hypothetical protein
MIQNSSEFGGALTVLWHDRSHGPERFWGDFYAKLVHKLRSLDVWFGTAGQVVRWFRKRRNVTFEYSESNAVTARVMLRSKGEKIVPPLILRVHRSDGCETHKTVDFPWTGETDIEVGQLLRSGRFASKSLCNAPA